MLNMRNQHQEEMSPDLYNPQTITNVLKEYEDVFEGTISS